MHVLTHVFAPHRLKAFFMCSHEHTHADLLPSFCLMPCSYMPDAVDMTTQAGAKKKTTGCC